MLWSHKSSLSSLVLTIVAIKRMNLNIASGNFNVFAPYNVFVRTVMTYDKDIKPVFVRATRHVMPQYVETYNPGVRSVSRNVRWRRQLGVTVMNGTWV